MSESLEEKLSGTRVVAGAGGDDEEEAGAVGGAQGKGSIRGLKVVVHVLHSLVAQAEQEAALLPAAAGTAKVVLSVRASLPLEVGVRCARQRARCFQRSSKRGAVRVACMVTPQRGHGTTPP